MINTNHKKRSIEISSGNIIANKSDNDGKNIRIEKNKNYTSSIRPSVISSLKNKSVII